MIRLFTKLLALKSLPRSHSERISSLEVQSDALKAIGILLYKSILAEKALQATQEAEKIAIKQAMRNFFGDTFGLLWP